MEKRNHYTAEFKTKIVLEVIREESTVNEIGARHGINPIVIGRWKQEFLKRSPEMFKKGPSEAEKELGKKDKHIAYLERKIGQLTYEVDWLKKKSDELFGRR